MAHVRDRWHKTDDGRKVRTDRYGTAGKRWQAVWVDPATRKERTDSFATKVEAERHIVGIESSKARGEYIAPEHGRITVAEWADRWMAGKANTKASTRDRYAGIVRNHVKPLWGHRQLADVTHDGIQQWISDLSASGQSPGSVVKIHRVMSMILAYAVKARRIPANLAGGVNLPRVTKAEKRYLTAEQVSALAQAAMPAGHVAVLTLAYCGLRWGELAALKVSRLDLLRRRLHVAESVTETDDGRLDWGLPKSHERRWVPVPRFLVDELAHHVEGKSPDDLVFASPKGAVLRVRGARRSWFDAAVVASGMPDGFHPHELRHTAASLAVSAGANVKAVSRMLGHAKASMTLDVYADLFDDDLENVAVRLDEIAVWSVDAPKITDQRPTNGVVIDLAGRSTSL